MTIKNTAVVRRGLKEVHAFAVEKFDWVKSVDPKRFSKPEQAEIQKALDWIAQEMDNGKVSDDTQSI